MMIINSTISEEIWFSVGVSRQRYENTTADTMKLVKILSVRTETAFLFMERQSIESLLDIQHIKYMFRRDLSLRGYNKRSATVLLLSIQLRQILVYYNCKTNKDSQEQKNV